MPDLGAFSFLFCSFLLTPRFSDTQREVFLCLLSLWIGFPDVVLVGTRYSPCVKGIVHYFSTTYCYHRWGGMPLSICTKSSILSFLVVIMNDNN
ncbi:hypothetical protein BDV41DRAFT_36555 [Aspergillus transmontanensis]|uniref:Uncharacterized protein n=1 Tax=Aspergillus transmontanensis TaxID=1034304 RepID=A0A5N6VGV9_9EURO|nr:hypothetical protein BDV41DRAFT_36555 [Aspergillus transmontanensis]